MISKIIHCLGQNQAQNMKTIIKNSSDTLIKKVLAEKTTFQKEHKKLRADSELKFYNRRDELINTLNKYGFGEVISNEEKKLLNYDQIKLTKSKNKKERISLLAVFGGLSLIGIGILYPPFLPQIALLKGSSVLSGMGLLFYGKMKVMDLKNMSENYAAMREFDILKGKSKQLDDFVHDIKLMEKKGYSYTDLKKQNYDDLSRRIIPWTDCQIQFGRKI